MFVSDPTLYGNLHQIDLAKFSSQLVSNNSSYFSSSDPPHAPLVWYKSPYCSSSTFFSGFWSHHTKFKQDIIKHHKYITNLYEKEPDMIAGNLTEILQDCLDIQAPVQVIQIPKRAVDKLSKSAREILAQHDQAHEDFKSSERIGWGVGCWSRGCQDCWGRDGLAWEPVRVERSTFVARLLIYY